jgi:hypothetical protein
MVSNMDRVLDFLNRHKATALALIAFFVGTVAFFNNGFELVKNHLIQKHAEDSLEKLNAGVSVKHVEAIFGAPIVERKTSKKGLSTYLYSFKKFYLQVVFDKENTVKFFAVTIKDASFNPKVPYLNQRLGKFRFSDMNSGKTLYSNKSSKFYEYAEFHYLGFPGNYRNIYIAYNPSGTDYGAQMESPSIPELELPSAIAKFKASAFPNTYGVGEILGDEDQWVPKTGVGIDFYTAIDLPEHNY